MHKKGVDMIGKSFQFAVVSLGVILCSNVALIKDAAASELIKNGDFAHGDTSWELKMHSDGAATGSVINGEYVIAIDGGSADWVIQFRQHALTIEKGKTYDISYDAYAMANRTFKSYISAGYEPYANFSPKQSPDLTTAKKRFTSRFTMQSPTDATARMLFDLGTSNIAVVLDNISIQEVGTVGVREVAQTTADKELLTNGDFSHGDTSWLLALHQTGGASGKVENGAWTITITNPGTTSWSVQPRIFGFGIQKGKTYIISYDAYAAANRSIASWIGSDRDPWGMYSPSQSVNLTTTSQHFSSTFDNKNTTDAFSRLNFDCGLSTISVTLANVSVKEVGGGTPVTNLNKMEKLNLRQNMEFEKNGLRISIADPSRSLLQVFDMRGRLVADMTDVISRLPAGAQFIPWSNLTQPGGVYAVHLFNGEANAADILMSAR
jgi:hypothetical protein